MPFYNTTGETGEDLRTYKRKAKSQEAVVLAALHIKSFTASEILAFAINYRELSPATPVTSIRRALTDLCTAGKVEQYGKRTSGPFNRLEFVWRLT